MRFGSLATVPGGPAGIWSFEIKWDGFRCIATLTRDRTRLVSRHATVMDRWFPSLERLGPHIGRNVTLDGEVVVLGDDGKPDFYAVRRRDVVHTFVAFDVLQLDGVDLTERPLRERQAILADIVVDAMPMVLRSRSFDDGSTLLAQAEALGLEGIVCKQRESRYLPGARTSAWRKVKTSHGLAEARRRKLIFHGDPDDA